MLSPFAVLRYVVACVRSIIGIFLWNQDHFAPHHGVGFEGFYSRVQLEDGGSLAVIFCLVKNAKKRGNLVFLTYIPGSQSTPSFTFERFPNRFLVTVGKQSVNGLQPFAMSARGIGTMEVTPESVIYNIDSEEDELERPGCTFKMTLTNHTPWSKNDMLSGPMGFVSRISNFLPLNWHVYSTHSQASYELSYNGHKLTGTGVAHIEKNWGKSFPKGWIWSQSFSASNNLKSLALAGGSALPGVQAYLIGYRSEKLHWDFRPPFAMNVGPFSPFLSVHRDSAVGRVSLVVQTFCRKLVVEIYAPKETFVPFPAPLRDGHHPGFAYESFKGEVWVEAWTRLWPWGKWRRVEEGVCGFSHDGHACAALEFGGSFSHLVHEQG